MSRHSLGAYRILLKMRSVKTLLVEGDDDKAVMHRLIHELTPDGATTNWPAVIDTPNLLADERLAGLGNRAKVELIATECAAHATDKFFALIDREWDGFDVESFTTHPPVERVLMPGGYLAKTFGHSIENYFIDAAIFMSFLRRHFAGRISPGALRLIEDHFIDSCTFALAYSLAANQLQIVSRIGGALRRSHVQYAESSFSIEADFQNTLNRRGVSADRARNFAATVATIQQDIRDKRAPLDLLKWGCHGHLGLECVWVCIAHSFEALGCDRDLCDRIEGGLNDDKLKHGADALATGGFERWPLDQLANWLNTPLAAA